MTEKSAPRAAPANHNRQIVGCPCSVGKSFAGLGGACWAVVPRSGLGRYIVSLAARRRLRPVVSFKSGPTKVEQGWRPALVARRVGQINTPPHTMLRKSITMECSKTIFEFLTQCGFTRASKSARPPARKEPDRAPRWRRERKSPERATPYTLPQTHPPRNKN